MHVCFCVYFSHLMTLKETFFANLNLYCKNIIIIIINISIGIIIIIIIINLL